MTKKCLVCELANCGDPPQIPLVGLLVSAELAGVAAVARSLCENCWSMRGTLSALSAEARKEVDKQ